MLVVAAACAPRPPGAPRGAPAPAPLDPACTAVAAALDSLVPTRAGARVAVPASTRPARPVPYAEALRDTPGLDSTTWTAFVAANRTPGATCAALAGGRPVVVVPDSVRRMPPGGDPEAYWRAFRRRYPGAAGLTMLSGVGIGAGGRQALLVIDHACGGLCGWGYVVLLERAPGGPWRVRAVRMTWVS